MGAGPLYKTKIVSWTFHNCIGQVKFFGGKWNFDATCPTGQVAKNLILHHWESLRHCYLMSFSMLVNLRKNKSTIDLSDLPTLHWVFYHMIVLNADQFDLPTLSILPQIKHMVLMCMIMDICHQIRKGLAIYFYFSLTVNYIHMWFFKVYIERWKDVALWTPSRTSKFLLLS